MVELVTVAEFAKRFEAEIAQGLLKEKRIDSMIKADDCGGQLMGFILPGKAGVKLQVREEDLEAAEEALAVLDQPEE